MIFNPPLRVKAMIHSLHEEREAIILEKMDNNHCIGEYNGVRCTAVHNVYNGLFYLDDVYGILSHEN